MDTALILLLTRLLRRGKIGGNHSPEAMLLRLATRGMSKQRLRHFKREYRSIQYCLIRKQKRTGKDYDWHISIDPRRVNDVRRIIHGVK